VRWIDTERGGGEDVLTGSKERLKQINFNQSGSCEVIGARTMDSFANASGANRTCGENAPPSEHVRSWNGERENHGLLRKIEGWKNCAIVSRVQ
jgi:hypothetical protein